MRQVIDIELYKNYPTEPWGFRLVGGMDFNSTLTIQRINPASLAENFGLRENDYVLAINNKPTETLTHEECKREIVNGGSSIRLAIERSPEVTSWQPHVEQLHTNSDILEENQLAVRTSLAKNKPVQEEVRSRGIGSSHNRSARPFNSNTDSDTAVLVNNQFNTPMGLYSNDNIVGMAKATVDAHQTNNINDNEPDKDIPDAPAPIITNNNNNNNNSQIKDTLEVFPKTERKNSYVLEALLDEDAPAVSNKPRQSLTFQRLENVLQNPGSNNVQGFRRVQAPTTNPNAPSQPQPQNSSICKACDRMILGVFVKVRGNPMHAECFKCKKCAKNLKNEGYFVVEDDLYCEADAKAVARPPNANMVANAIYK